MLSQTEHDMILIAAYEWRKKLAMEDDSLDNLRWLYLDLLRESGSFWPLIHHYVELLQKESALIEPFNTYEAGKRFGAAGVRIGQAWVDFLGEIENSPAARSLRGAMQTVYEYLVGVTDKKGLIQEFVREYQRIFGPAEVFAFFKIGYLIGQRTRPELVEGSK